MSILQRIIETKRREVQAKKAAFPLECLKKSTLFKRQPLSFSSALRHSPHGIIAEHKRRSPSRSVINQQSDLCQVITGYTAAGVSAISVLTDTPFFGGSLDDLLVARQHSPLPLLRKDFMVDPYQFYEAKAYGADAVLLIAAALNDEELSQFSRIANGLGLEVLLEVHDRAELERSLTLEVAMTGINNRDLKTFQVAIQTSLDLAAMVPGDRVRVSESGIGRPETVKLLQEAGYQGFLMGEHFMKSDDPGQSVKNFIERLDA